MRLLAVLVAICALSQTAIAQTSECKSITDSGTRLACYDRIAATAASSAAAKPALRTVPPPKADAAAGEWPPRWRGSKKACCPRPAVARPAFKAPTNRKKDGIFAILMNLLESLPTVIGTAAVAPALLILWLVIAAGERPGPPARVWTAFLLGAASISLLGVARAPFASILAAPENPWVAQVIHSIFGVAAPEETGKILVIVAVSTRRRAFAAPMDTVVYGAAAGLGFAAYENLAYLEQHTEMWRALAALRIVLTVPFHGALGIIAGAYLAIARSGTALGAHRHHRDWARLLSRGLILLGPLGLHAGF